MTIDRMHIEFKILLDKIDSSAYPDILTPEIDFWLNDGYIRFIKTRYDPNNIYQKGFEGIQKRTDDLKELVLTKFAKATLLTTDTDIYSVNLKTLYEDAALSVQSTASYMFYIRGRVNHILEGCGSRFMRIVMYEQDDLAYALENPFTKPSISESVGYFEAGSLMVATDGSYTVDKMMITFIKLPLLIDKAQILSPLGLPGTSSIEVDPHTHSEIVRLAVDAALESIESQRVKTFPEQLNKIE